MSQPSKLNLYIVTFNCGRALIKPEAFASHFFDALPDSASANQPPDLIVLNLQEIAPLAEAFSGHALPKYYERFGLGVRLAVKQWFTDNHVLGDEDGSTGGYVEFTKANAGLTAIMVFVRADLQHRIGSVLSANVGVGVQKVGNKGAAGIRLAWRVRDSASSSTAGDGDIMNLTFVSAHLAPFEEAVERRNQDFLDIAAGLVFEPKRSTDSASLSSSGSQQQNNEESEPLLTSDTDDQTQNASSSTSNLLGMYNADSHLFFAGDLNYRTSSTRPVHDSTDAQSFPQPAVSPSSPKHYSHLLSKDQLTTQLASGKTLHGLTESPIDFPPTYKYSAAACGNSDIMLDSQVTEWKWSTHRWPSWCDRILYSARDSDITVHRYTALPLLATSDHRAVALSTSVLLKPVQNHDFAGKRPVAIDPNWKTNRDAARMKEMVVGAVWGTVSTTDGLLNLTMGVAAVACIVIFATVYMRDW